MAPAVDLARLADLRASLASLLDLLDEAELCQAAAYVSMALDVLDRVAGELPPHG
ncbi:MAG TPA: hypothetical protein VF605_19375 [Allosphingosinicella sp.]|jgi:hypothetical protein